MNRLEGVRRGLLGGKHRHIEELSVGEQQGGLQLGVWRSQGGSRLK